MKGIVIRGEWHSPTNETLKLPGLLRIEESKIELTLYGNSDFFGNPIIGTGQIINNYDILLGESDDKKITLVNCDLRDRDKIGASLDTFILSPRFVLRGAHFQSIEEINLTSVSCTFSYLSAWMDGQEFYHFHDEALTTRQLEEKIAKRTTVNLSQGVFVDIERILLTNEFAGRNTVSSSVRHFANFRSIMALQLKEFEIMIQRFRKLISFAIDDQIDVQYSHAVSSNPEDQGVEIIQRRAEKFTDFGSADYRNSSFMLFNAHALGEECFKNVVSKWFETIDRFGVIYDLFLDTQRNRKHGMLLTGVVFNNRLLNVIQCLESFHTIKYPVEEESKEAFKTKFNEIVSKLSTEDKNWLKKRTFKFSMSLEQRLFQLISDNDLLFEGIFIDKKEMEGFAAELSEIRNMLSHGRHTRTDNVSEFWEYYNLSRILLMACILSNLGFGKDEISGLIEKSFEHGRKLRLLRFKLNRSNSR